MPPPPAPDPAPIPTPAPAPAVSEAKALAIIAASILAFWLLAAAVALFDATAAATGKAGPVVASKAETIPLAVPEEAGYEGPTTATLLSVKLCVTSPNIPITHSKNR